MSSNAPQQKATFTLVQPVLPVRDVDAAITYYVKQLGFTLKFQDQPSDSQPGPRYAGVSRDGVEIHLQWHDAAEWHTVERPMLRFVIEDLDALFTEYHAAGATKPGSAIQSTAWGTREFAFYDPDQNGLTFYCDLS